MPKVVASIEARMGSSRLPGKVLADIGGRPALSHLIERLRRVSNLDGIVLATTTESADDVLEEWAGMNEVPVFRGSEVDVLARVAEAHSALDTEVVVEVTGDSVFLDPGVVEETISTFLINECHIVTNSLDAGYPIGMAVDVFRFDDLVHVARTVCDVAVREHVSLYFYEHPERYRAIYLSPLPAMKMRNCRIVLDYEEDLTFLREIWTLLSPRFGDGFGLAEVVELLRREPSIAQINSHCVQKSPR